jgi:transposase
MRKDVELYVKLEKEKEAMNKSEISRRFDCNWRTVDRYVNGNSSERKPRKYVSILENYKNIIIEKIDNCASNATSVYNFIKKKGYKGGYLTVNNFVKEHKKEEVKKATFRFETVPGLQAQVDWKERVKMANRNGEILEINIFLIILGYSRMKYIKLTDNKTQRTLFECMYNAFKYFQGIPKEILFDNMATVVDRENSTFKNVAINKKFKNYSRDAGFEPITCRPYRPQTKGKVEVLAKLINRLRVYNHEFDTFEDLDKIIIEFNEELNNEVHQTTKEKPINRFQKEKEYLNPLVSENILISYYYQEKEYKVSNESMINYKGKKYSVPTRLIGLNTTVCETQTEINIYYIKEFIVSHPKTDKYLNYKIEHAKEILKSDVLSDWPDSSIDRFIENNLKKMDIFLS